MRKRCREFTPLAGLLAGLLAAAGAGAAEAPAAEAPKEPVAAPPGDAAPSDEAHRVVRGGVVVEFSVERLDGNRNRPLLEGDYAVVKFRMTDASTGRPVPGAKPAAWLDIGGVIQGPGGQQRECKDKISLYLQGIVGIRPMVDLNSYYVLVMNKDPTIAVIDPVVSMTGQTSLYAMARLKSPGADWAKSKDEKRLFISMPRVGQVAVMDTDTFKVVAEVDAGKRPTRTAVQPDGRYLWIANDAEEPSESGVTVVDADSLKPVAHIPTGRGHHELAFSSDDRYAFVSNRGGGTVSVIDVAALKKVKDLETGPVPISLAFSPLSQALYAADGRSGRITVVDGKRLRVVARIRAKPGLGPMRFSRDGRWGFVVNTSEHALHVVDATENRLAHTIPLGAKPYQVAVSRAFAYVRMLDSERVSMVNLQSLGKGKKPIVLSFGAGGAAPQLAGNLSMADAISPSAIEAAVFVLNPAENVTYFYMEGMNAPMGSYVNYGHAAAAIGLVDRSLKEVEPGVFTGKVRFPAAGRYDVAFLLESPRVLHCFATEAKANPALKHPAAALEIEYLDFPARVASRAPVALRFRLTDPVTREPRTGLEDVRVLYFASSMKERTELRVREVGAGVYEAEAAFPSPGAYYTHVAVPSLGVGFQSLPYRSLIVEAAGGKPPAAVPPDQESEHAARSR